MGWLLAIAAAILGVVFAVAGVRGNQGAVFAAVTGHGLETGSAGTSSGSSTSTSSSGTAGGLGAAINAPSLVQGIIDDALAAQRRNGSTPLLIGRPQ